MLHMQRIIHQFISRNNNNDNKCLWSTKEGLYSKHSASSNNSNSDIVKKSIIILSL
jgi:hypothetical protein